MQTPEPHPTASVLGALFLTLLAFVSGVGAFSLLREVRNAETAAVVQAFPAPITLDPNVLTAKAAIVYDPTTHRILYEKNSSAPMPLASLTKLVTATAILDHVTGNPTITITKDHLVQEGAQADASFSSGDRITLHNLLKIGLIASSNDAMQAAATTLGSDYTQVLEATVFNLGLSHMQFNNGTGLDMSTTTAGAYGSAYDMAIIAANFAQKYPEYFTLTQLSDVTIPAGWGGTIQAQATMQPLQSLPGFVGAKTGYTTLAGGNVVALFDIEVGHPLVIVVLDSTQSDRFTDIQTLLEAAQNADTHTL